MNSVPTPSPKTILDLADAVFERDPDRAVLLSNSRALTAKELRQSADRLARAVVPHGAGPDRTIGLCLERSPELIVSVLGILKAGAAYVPIDPTYPAERIALMLEDARPPVVITDKAHQHLFAGTTAKVLLIEDIDLENGPLFEGPCPASPENLAYVLFTSGSTGRPKGCREEAG